MRNPPGVSHVKPGSIASRSCRIATKSRKSTPNATQITKATTPRAPPARPAAFTSNLKNPSRTAVSSRPPHAPIPSGFFHKVSDREAGAASPPRALRHSLPLPRTLCLPRVGLVRPPAGEPRHEGRHPLPVSPVGLAELGLQLPLLPPRQPVVAPQEDGSHQEGDEGGPPDQGPQDGEEEAGVLGVADGGIDAVRHQ